MATQEIRSGIHIVLLLHHLQSPVLREVVNVRKNAYLKMCTRKEQIKKGKREKKRKKEKKKPFIPVRVTTYNSLPTTSAN